MSLRIAKHESWQDVFQRLLREQVEAALGELSRVAAPSAAWDEAIHEARNCFKRIRAVLRLFRQGTGSVDFARENLFFRDLARSLASARDALVQVEALRHLRECCAENHPEPLFSRIEQELLNRYHERCGAPLEDGEGWAGINRKLDAFRLRLHATKIMRKL